MNQLNSNRIFDLVIIGDGIASRFLQEKLFDSGKDILVIDAGPSSKGKRNKKLFNISQNINKNHHSINNYHLSGKGGTSQTWGGRLTPYTFLPKVNNQWLQNNEYNKDYKAAYKFFGISQSDLSKRWDLSNESVGNTIFRDHTDNFNQIRFSKNDQFKNIYYKYSTKVERFIQKTGYIELFCNKNKCLARGKKIIIASGSIQSTSLIDKSIYADIQKNILMVIILGLQLAC